MRSEAPDRLERVFTALRDQLTPETILYAIESAAALVAEALDAPELAPDPRLAELESELAALRRLGGQGREVAHLIAELEAERAQLTKPAKPAVDVRAPVQQAGGLLLRLRRHPIERAYMPCSKVVPGCSSGCPPWW